MFHKGGDPSLHLLHQNSLEFLLKVRPGAITSSSSRLSNWLASSQVLPGPAPLFSNACPLVEGLMSSTCKKSCHAKVPAHRQGSCTTWARGGGLAALLPVPFSVHKVPPADPRALTGPLVPCEVSIPWPQET